MYQQAESEVERIAQSYQHQKGGQAQPKGLGESVTNHPQWGNPNGSVTSGSFMRITATRGGARYVRLGLKLDF